jgi:hypothetical protein
VGGEECSDAKRVCFSISIFAGFLLSFSQERKRLENTRKDQEKKEREEAEFLALKLEVETNNPTLRSQLYGSVYRLRVN